MCAGYCETYFDTFESLCDNIAGDSPMHTMFRRDAEPVKCPFKGPFLFSYTKGGSGLNKCSYPPSYLDSCSDNHRLQLNFQACIDVQGSESATEELECLATWSEGSKNYLVAEMNREHVYSDESKYRCFVYEKAGKGDNRTVRMAQSLAATCTGLWSPLEGYRTFDMNRGEPHKDHNQDKKYLIGIKLMIRQDKRFQNLLKGEKSSEIETYLGILGYFMLDIDNRYRHALSNPVFM